MKSNPFDRVGKATEAITRMGEQIQKSIALPQVKIPRVTPGFDVTKTFAFTQGVSQHHENTRESLERIEMILLDIKKLLQESPE